MFESSCSLGTTQCGEAGREVHGPAPGAVMTVAFEPDGLAFTALDGTHAFRFTEAVSFQVLCDTQSGETMFDPITLPFGVKMLFNTVKLKPGVKFEDVELAVGEMCNVVKDTYGDDKGGFIAGQVFRFSGFVSPEGSLGATTPAEEHYAIVTYWRSFEQHESSHADETFTSKFEELAKMCSETRELGYDMLWQGTPERA